MPRARSPSALWFVNAVGNPNVNPEDATTYTAGFVWQPSTGRPLRDGFSGTLDWYEIEIEDMIAVEPGSAVYEACLSPTSNPAFDVNHEACRRIIRNPSTGGATASNVSYINAGGALLSGIDLAANWQADLADMGFQRLPGTFAVNFLVSTLLDLETQATPTSPVIDWKGSLGPDPGTSLNNGAFDYRTFTTLSYSFNDWNVSRPSRRRRQLVRYRSRHHGRANGARSESDDGAGNDRGRLLQHSRPPALRRRRGAVLIGKEAWTASFGSPSTGRNEVSARR